MENEPELETPPPRVLIIDDEPAALRLIRVMLTRNDYVVTACENAIQALKAMEQERFDCIITDAAMPEMSGLDLVRSVRAHPTHFEIPILMLTRKRLREDVTEAVQAGVTDYVLKPIDEHLLMDKVELCLTRGEGKRHVFEHRVSGPSAKGHLQLKATVRAVSESGVTVVTSLALDAGMHFALDGPIFAEIGIRPPLLRLLDCQLVENPTADPELAFEARYAFVGVEETDLRKIRAWLHKQEIQRRK